MWQYKNNFQRIAEQKIAICHLLLEIAAEKIEFGKYSQLLIPQEFLSQ